jgi:PAS domain S-box-containing protein
MWDEDFSAITRRFEDLRQKGIPDLRTYMAEHPDFVDAMIALVVVRDVNRASLRLCDAQTKDQMLSSLHRVFLPETRIVFREKLLAIWEGRRSFQAETVLQTLNGQSRHVALIMDLPEDDPTLANVLVTLMDLTPRREAEALMRSSDERQKRAVEAGKVGLWEWDIKRNIVTWSDHIYTLHGLQPGTFSGTVEAFAELVEPQDRDHVSESLKTALAGGADYNAEFRPVRPDGQLKWLATTGRVTFDAHGQPAWMHGAVLDRTEQKKVEQAQRETERQLMLLVEASGALLASPHLHEVLRTIVELGQRFVSADAYSVWRRQGKDDVWNIASSAGLSEEFSRTSVRRANTDLPPLNSPLIIEDVAAEPMLADRHEALIREGVRSMLVIPLNVHDQASGTVVFYWRTAHRFTDTEIRIASTLGNLAASALGNAELYERQIELRAEAESSERRASFLAQAGALLASSLDYEATLKSVAKLAVPTFADWSSVDLATRGGDIKRVAVAHSDPEKVRFAYEYARRYPPREDDTGRIAFRTGQSILLEEITDELLVSRIADPEKLSLIRELGLRSAIIAPMVVNGKSLGGISFVVAESGRQYTAADLQTAEELARRAATAIEHAGLYRDVRNSEERYRSLVSATTSIVWTIDSEGAFVEPQSSWEAYTGQSWEEHKGFGWANALHPEDRERVLAGWFRCRDEQKTYDVEGRVWHAPSGEYRYFVARPAPVRNEDGSIREWVGTVTDIHERHVAEEQRHQAERDRNTLLVREQEARRTAELLNRVGPILSVELDPEKLAQKITNLATELAGAELGALFQGRSDEESFLPYTVAGAPYEAFSNVPIFDSMSKGQGIIRSDDIWNDVRYQHQVGADGVRAGELAIRSYLAVPVISRSGAVLGGLVFGHTAVGVFGPQASELVHGLAAQAAIALDNARLFDDSQRTQEALRRSNQELRRANEDLNQFAYSASHDLREPLRMVSLYSQLLKKKYGSKLDDQADRYLNFAVDGAQRMETLVSDILAYTQAASPVTEDLVAVDANVVLEKAISNLRGVIEQSGADLKHSKLPMIRVHEVHLLQLFQNVVSNAIKYRSESTPEIRITATWQDNGWLLSVSDNGIGVEPEYKEQIFGLFKRLHPAAEYAGTGLGLAICQRIVERYHGRIWVESEPGRGSTFFFTLPGTESG